MNSIEFKKPTLPTRNAARVALELVEKVGTIGNLGQMSERNDAECHVLHAECHGAPRVELHVHVHGDLQPLDSDLTLGMPGTI